jgi:probable F420-dependent oxidoreductase
LITVVPEGQVAWGIQLPVQAQSTLFAAPWERQAGGDEIAAVAEAADRAGAFTVAVCDHIAIPRDRAEAMSTTWYDTVATLSFIAARTQNVRLLSHVYVAAYRHPLHTANAFATLDTLSKGRVILGVGTGHVEDEFAALGVDFHRRGALLNEAIDAVRAAWENEFVPGIDVGVAPRPVQQPRPPIWVGGSSDAALKRAAERGDGWLPQGTPLSQMPDAVRFIREHRAKTIGDQPIDIGGLSFWLYVGEPPELHVKGKVASGSPDEVAGALRPFVDAGVNHLQVRFPSRDASELCDQLEAFGATVAPLLQP